MAIKEKMLVGPSMKEIAEGVGVSYHIVVQARIDRRFDIEDFGSIMDYILRVRRDRYRFPFNFIAELTRNTRDEILRAREEGLFDSGNLMSVIIYIHAVREEKRLPSLKVQDVEKSEEEFNRLIKPI